MPAPGKTLCATGMGVGVGVFVDIGVLVGVAVFGISVDDGVVEGMKVGVRVGVFVGVVVNVEVRKTGTFVDVGSCSCFSSVAGHGIDPPVASKHPPSWARTKFCGKHKNTTARIPLVSTNKKYFMFYLIGVNLPAEFFQFRCVKLLIRNIDVHACTFS